MLLESELAVTQCGLRFYVLGNILRGANESDRCPGFIPDDVSDCVKMAHRPIVTAQHTIDVIVRTGSSQRVGDRLPEIVTILGVDLIQPII